MLLSTCTVYVLPISCIHSPKVLTPCREYAIIPKVPLILWIGYKQSTRCGRVHFEHSHRKWLVITVRPTTSVRESPRKNLPPRNTPDLFCRRFTRQNPSLCCMGGIFLLRETHLENFMSRPDVIPTFRQRRCTNRGRNFVRSKR